MNSRKLKKLKNPDYRAAYVEAHIDQGLAHQIRILRENRGWDQKRMANELGLKSQSAVARMEDPSYGKLSLSTLKKLARVFDVALLTKFVPFSRLITEVESISEENLSVDPFELELPSLENSMSVLRSLRVYGQPQYLISAPNNSGSPAKRITIDGTKSSSMSTRIIQGNYQNA